MTEIPGGVTVTFSNGFVATYDRTTDQWTVRWDPAYGAEGEREAVRRLAEYQRDDIEPDDLNDNRPLPDEDEDDPGIPPNDEPARRWHGDY